MTIAKNMILIDENTFETVLSNIEEMIKATNDRFVSHMANKDLNISKEDAVYLFSTLSKLEETAHKLAKAKDR